MGKRSGDIINWPRYKKKAAEADWYCKRGGRFVKGPFTGMPPAAISNGKRGWFKGSPMNFVKGRR